VRSSRSHARYGARITLDLRHASGPHPLGRADVGIAILHHPRSFRT
jgi:hypothetical protein